MTFIESRFVLGNIILYIFYVTPNYQQLIYTPSVKLVYSIVLIQKWRLKPTKQQNVHFYLIHAAWKDINGPVPWKVDLEVGWWRTSCTRFIFLEFGFKINFFCFQEGKIILIAPSKTHLNLFSAFQKRQFTGILWNNFGEFPRLVFVVDFIFHKVLYVLCWNARGMICSNKKR